MKKLLIAALVLGLVNSASAALVLGTSDTVRDPGSTISITLSTNAGEAVNFAYMVLISDNGAGGTATPGSWNTDFDFSTNAGANGTVIGYNAGDLVGAVGEDDPTEGVTGTLYTYSYTISPSVTVGQIITLTIEDMTEYGLTSIAYSSDGSIISLPTSASFVIPEPMTIALLGLGGLLLRRRK